MTIRLTNWRVVGVMPSSGFLRLPENATTHLSGVVTGHPKKADGTPVTTSRVVGRDGSRIVTESGSRYELGDVDPAYEQVFLGAKNRFLASLPQVKPT